MRRTPGGGGMGLPDIERGGTGGGGTGLPDTERGGASGVAGACSAAGAA